MKRYLFLLCFALIHLPFVVEAHPGNTDSSGCHTCKTNCPKWGLDYGEYHCHASKGVPQPIEPVRSIKSDTGAGMTVPAPEYKTPSLKSVEKAVPPPKPINNEVKVQSKLPVQEIQVNEVRVENNKTIETLPQPKQEKKKNVLSRFFSWIF